MEGLGHQEVCLGIRSRRSLSLTKFLDISPAPRIHPSLFASNDSFMERFTPPQRSNPISTLEKHTYHTPTQLPLLHSHGSLLGPEEVSVQQFSSRNNIVSSSSLKKLDVPSAHLQLTLSPSSVLNRSGQSHAGLVPFPNSRAHGASTMSHMPQPYNSMRLSHSEELFQLARDRDDSMECGGSLEMNRSNVPSKVQSQGAPTYRSDKRRAGNFVSQPFIRGE